MHGKSEHNNNKLKGQEGTSGHFIVQLARLLQGDRRHPVYSLMNDPFNKVFTFIEFKAAKHLKAFNLIEII